MGFAKILKTKQYFKRYNVKFRRRRQNKTDYQQRRALICQDKTKYNTPKYRLVVRITGKDVICQVTMAKITGDKVIAAAYAHELPRYGLKVGLTNYAACYCTGLLLARRLLKKVGLDKHYIGVEKADGEQYEPDEEEAEGFDDPDDIKRPFRCYLDIGLQRTTTGARIFGCLKGAVDGGLDIPHSTKRFPGYKKAKDEDGDDEYDPAKHRERIFGTHVANYMKKMEEKDADKFKAHFSQYIKAGLGPDNLESMYEKVHEAIRANPEAPPKKKRDLSGMKTFPNKKKTSHSQRKNRIQQKIRAAREQLKRQQEAEEMKD